MPASDLLQLGYPMEAVVDSVGAHVADGRAQGVRKGACEPTSGPAARARHQLHSPSSVAWAVRSVDCRSQQAALEVILPSVAFSLEKRFLAQIARGKRRQRSPKSMQAGAGAWNGNSGRHALANLREGPRLPKADRARMANTSDSWD